MKLVKSRGDAFDFKYSGTLTVAVTSEGVVVSDEIAQVMVDRLPVDVSEAPEGTPGIGVPEAVPVIETVDVPPAPEPLPGDVLNPEPINP